jgi:protein dithiol oxidoreductase (disulfide-forming)
MKAVVSVIAMFLLASIAACAPTAAPAAAPAPAPASTQAAAPPAKWVEGRNYFLIQPPHPPSLPPGKVEVTEVFSYACPACNQFQPHMRKLQRTLPANVVVDFVPASFNPAEDWPMFQLAYATAQALGVADQTHDAMFDAVWTTGELGISDPTTEALKPHMPTIEDAARFYQKHAGVPTAKFLSMSKTFPVDSQLRKDEELIKAYGVDRTPTIVVNGKYRLHVQAAGGPEELIDLVNWLVAKESK